MGGRGVFHPSLMTSMQWRRFTKAEKDLVPAPLLSPASPSRGVDPTPGRQGEPLHTAGSCTAEPLQGKEETRETVQEAAVASGATVSEAHL